MNNVYSLDEYRAKKKAAECFSIAPIMNICPDFFAALCNPFPEPKSSHLKLVK